MFESLKKLLRRKKVEFLYGQYYPITDNELAIIGDYYKIDITQHDKIIKAFNDDIRKTSSAIERYYEIEKRISLNEFMQRKLAAIISEQEVKRKSKNPKDGWDNENIKGIIEATYNEEVKTEDEIDKLEREKRLTGIEIKKLMMRLIGIGKKLAILKKSKIGIALIMLKDRDIYYQVKNLPILKLEKSD
ncbi:MAG: hypothetical protein AABX19_04305 [Nanoarchaeota archaeon]